MAKKKTKAKAKSTKRVRKVAAKDATLTAVEAKIAVLEENLEQVKEVTISVLEEEIDRSKKIAVEVRQQLHKVRQESAKAKG